MNTSSSLDSFLLKNGHHDRITPIPKEASVRNYFRLHYEDFTRILCIDEKFTEIPYPFLEVQKYLETNGFIVPKVLDFDPSIHAILLSDEGEKDLTDLSESEYVEKVLLSLDLILELQKLQPTELISSKSFDYTKLRFEFDTTISAYERFKEKYNLDIDINPPGMEFFDNLLKFLAAFPNKVVCHRDFHARNLLQSRRGLCLIDFQDMMMGTPQYDLSSILYDAYRPLPLKIREELYNSFKSRSEYKENRFREYYLTQCLQRSFKALGTYLIMYNDKGYTKYKESIPACLDNILEIVQLGGFPNSIYLFAFFLREKWDSLPLSH